MTKSLRVSASIVRVMRVSARGHSGDQVDVDVDEDERG